MYVLKAHPTRFNVICFGAGCAASPEKPAADRLLLTACMRKLLVIVNALVKTGQSWNPKLAP